MKDAVKLKNDSCGTRLVPRTPGGGRLTPVNATSVSSGKGREPIPGWGRGGGFKPTVADGRYNDPNVNFIRLSSRDEYMKESR